MAQQKMKKLLQGARENAAARASNDSAVSGGEAPPFQEAE
jgi:hypothetical protein